jgi:LacI family transcriptional regulator
MTVSRLLTGRGRVAPDTARRIRRVLMRLRYRPNAPARLLRGRQSRLVGVTIPSLASAVHRGIVTGLEEVLRPADYQVLLGHRPAQPGGAGDLMSALGRQHCDAYVIIPARSDVEGTTRTRLDRPAVVAMASVPGLQADQVLVDGVSAARAATAFLLERFGAPVCLVNTVSRLSHDVSLLHGYRHALREAGETPRLLLVRPEADDSRERVRRLFGSPRPPRGVLLASSLVAFEGLGALVQSGRVPGRDIGAVVVATEEHPWTALLPSEPSLLLIPALGVGRQAGELLLQRLRGQLPPERQTRMLPIEFRP